MSDTGPAAPLPPISLSAEHKEIKLPPIQLPPISSLASPGGSSINSHAGLHDKPTSATTSPQGQMIAPQVSPPRTSVASSASKTPSLSPSTKDSVATDLTLRSSESACPPSPRVSEPQPTPHQQQASSIPGASAAAAILAQNVVVSAATAFNTPTPSPSTQVTQTVPSGSPCPNQPASPANANLPPPSSPMRLNRPPPGVPVPSEHILQRIAQQDSAHRAQQSSAAQQRLAPPPETTSNAQFAHPQGGVNVNGAPQQQQPPPGGLQQSQLTHQQQLTLIARRRQQQQANMQQTQRQRKAAAGQAAQNRQGNTATAQQNRSSPFNQAPSPSNNLQGVPSGSPRPVISGGRPPGVPSPASGTSEPPMHQQQVHMQQRTLPQGLHPQGTIPTAQHPLPVQLGRYPPPRPMPKGAAATSQAGHPTQLHQAPQPSRQFQVNRAPGQAVVGVPQTCGRAAGPIGGQHPVMQHQQMQGQGVGVAVAGPSSAVPLPRTQAAAALFNEEPKPGSAKEEYRMLKRKFKYLVYENECYQEQLRNLQRKLLKLSRDKNFLLDRLTSYEKLSESSDDDSDTSQRTLVDDRPKTKKKKANRKRPAAPPSGVAVAVSGASAAVASTSSAAPLASTSTSAPGPSGLSSQPPPAKKSNANPGIHQMLAQHSQHMQQLQRQQMILQHQQRMQHQDQRLSQQAAGTGASGQGMSAQEPNTMLRTRLPSHSGPRQPPILQQPSSSGMSVGGPPVNSGAEAPLNLHTSGNPSTMGSTQPQRLRNPSGSITSVAGHQPQPSSSGQQLPASSAPHVQQAPTAPQRKQAGKPGHRRHPPLTAAAHRILQQRQHMQDQAQLQQQQQQRQQLLLQQQHAQQLQMNALGLRTVDEQRITVEQHLRQQASKGELVSKPKNNHMPFLTNGGGGVLRVEQPSVASRSGEPAPVTQAVSTSVTQPVSAPVTQPVSAVSLSDQTTGGQTILARVDAEPTSTPSTNLEQVGSQPADSTLRKHTEPGTVGALIDGTADRAQREGDSTVKREEQQQNSDVVAPQRSISNGPTTIESPPSVSTEENQTRHNGESDSVLVKEKNEEETEDIRTVKREHGDGEKQTLKKKKDEPLVNGSQDNGDVSIGGEAESL